MAACVESHSCRLMPEESLPGPDVCKFGDVDAKIKHAGKLRFRFLFVAAVVGI